MNYRAYKNFDNEKFWSDTWKMNLTILTRKNCALFDSVQEWLLGSFICLHNQLTSMRSNITY